MTIIIDANILISSIITPYGTTSEIIVLNSKRVDFVIPAFSLSEVNAHKQRICRGFDITEAKFDDILNNLLSHIIIFSSESVPEPIIIAAEDLTSSIDIKDTIYVGFSIALDAIFWTGDLKLYRGLRRKSF